MSIRLYNGCEPLSENKIKKLFSEHFFAVLCAHSKYAFEHVDTDSDYGIDFRIKELIFRNGLKREGKELLRIQVKSSVDWKIENNYISYKLANKSYNDIIQHNIDNDKPLIVILLCLHKEQLDWVLFDDNKNTVNSSFYWYHTSEIILKNNEESKTTIQIPTKQRLKLNTLTELIEKFQIKKV